MKEFNKSVFTKFFVNRIFIKIQILSNFYKLLSLLKEIYIQIEQTSKLIIKEIESRRYFIIVILTGAIIIILQLIDYSMDLIFETLWIN